MTARRTDEERLQRAVVQLLTLVYPDLCWRAIPNGEYRSPRTAGRLKAMGVQPGVADLHITIPYGGNTAWIELKSGPGRQSPEQRAFEQSERAAGARYQICRSIDDVTRTLHEWGIRPIRKSV